MPEPKRLDLYVGTVSAVGLGLLAAILWGGIADLRHTPAFWVLTALVVLAELLSIKVRHRDEVVEEITISTTFSFALLLALGATAGVLAQAIASVIGDVSRRKSPRKTAFNVAQYTLSLAAAGAVMHVLDAQAVYNHDSVSAKVLIDVLLSGSAFFLVNISLTNVAVALAQGESVGASLRRDLWFQGSTDMVLLGLAPIVVIAAQKGLALLPLLALPMTAVAKAASASLENAALIDELRQQAAEKEHQALHDSLTGLPNRTLFHDRVRQAVVTARRERTEVAVLIMDLDRFKEINDTLGHHNGDLLLQEVGARLCGALRTSDTIARLGGDEFAILLPKVSSREATETTAEKVLEALRRPIRLQSMSVDIGGSLGIALCPDHGEDADVLIQKADVAMYAAKELRIGFTTYSPEQDKYSPDRLALVGELRQAIDDDDLLLLYQPKAELATGTVTGVEALLRWDHPRRGRLAPSEFIPLAEHTGLIRPLTFHVLDHALRQCRKWHSEGLDLHVAINLSAQSLLDGNFPGEVARLLSKWNVRPGRLELELTESSIMADPFRALDVLTKLNDMGIRLAIDDYGTGYSSLAYLKQLPVGTIKIDRSFIMAMASSENDAVIVRSTIDLGRNLGLEVVAEGVETQEVWDELAALECDQAQGYYLSKPVAADEITALVLQRPLDHQPERPEAAVIA